MNTQFARSRNDKMFAGVCGGIANYFSIDPAIVPLLFVLAVFLGGASPLIYLVLWIVMPEEPAAYAPTQTTYAAPQALPHQAARSRAKCAHALRALPGSRHPDRSPIHSHAARP